MIDVHEALNLREGNLMAAFLADHGIPAEVRGGAYQSVGGELSNIRGILPRVYVLDDGDAEQALALVASYLESLRRGPEGAPWVCACGETHEPQFMSCWKCQAARPEPSL